MKNRRDFLKAIPMLAAIPLVRFPHEPQLGGMVPEPHKDFQFQRPTEIHPFDVCGLLGLAESEIMFYYRSWRASGEGNCFVFRGQSYKQTWTVSPATEYGKIVARTGRSPYFQEPIR